VELIPLSVFYVTGGERIADIIFRALSCRYHRVAVGYEHGNSFSFLYAESGCHRKDTFTLPPLPRYLKLLYQWTRVAVRLLRWSGGDPWQIVVSEGIQFSMLAPLLKRCKGSGRFIFYSQDWWPVNPIIQLLDRFCVAVTDETWNLTPRIVEGRQQRWGRVLSGADRVVPIVFGPQSPREWRFNRNDIRCCFVGAIRPNVGLEWVLWALTQLRSEGIVVNLDIVGKPVCTRTWERLHTLGRQLGISEQIHWHGFLPTEQMLSILQTAACGFAIFPGGYSNYSNWTYAGKVFEYLEGGIPVVISRANFLADEIVERQAGIPVDDSAESVLQALRQLFGNPEDLIRLRQNAYKFACEKAKPDQLYAAIEQAARICCP